MKKILFILGVFLFITILGIIVVPSLVNLNHYKKVIISSLKNSTGINFSIDGDIEFKILPQPLIRIHHSFVSNLASELSNSSIMSVETADIKLSLFSLIKGKLEIKGVRLIDPVIDLQSLQNKGNNWDAFITNKKMNLTIIRTIDLKNAHVNYNSNNYHLSLDYLDMQLYIDPRDGSFDVVGKFDVNQNIVKFEGSADKFAPNGKVKIKLSGENFSTNFEGVYQNLKEDTILKGLFNTEISNLSNFVKDFFDEASVFYGITSSEKVKLTSKVNFGKRKSSLYDLVIDSENLKAKGNIDTLIGNGDEAPLSWDSALTISLLNIDNLIHQKTENNKNTGDYYISTLKNTNFFNYDINVPKELSMLLDMNIEKIVYMGKPIENVKINTDIADGTILIHKLGANLPGSSSIEFIGNMNHNGIRPLLKGVIHFEGTKFRDIVTWLAPNSDFIPKEQLNDFMISCSLNMTPQKIIISDIYGAVDRLLLTGNINVLPRAKTPMIQADMKLDGVDLDKYDFTNQIDKTVKRLFSYNENNTWLRNFVRSINYNLSLILNITDIIYNNNKIDSLNTSVVLYPNTVDVQRLTLNGEKISLVSLLKLKLEDNKPTFKFMLGSKGIDTSIFILPEKDKSIKDTSESDKSSDLKNPDQWSRKEFSFLGLGDYEGDVDIAITQLKYKKITYKNLKFKAIVANRVLQVKDAMANIGSGKLEISSNIRIIAPVNMATSFKLSDVRVSDLYSLLNRESNQSGIVNLGGSIHTSGSSPFEWIKNMKGDLEFVTDNIVVKDFDLNSIIQGTIQLYSVLDMQEVVKKAMSGGSTVFIGAGGKAKIDKNIISANNVNIYSEYSRGIFAGNLDINNLNINSVAKIAFAPAPNKKVSLLLNVKGSLDNLEKTIDTKSLDSYITSKGSLPKQIK